ncbi:glycosyltransferase family 4 protein [Kocuria sp. ZOR0020]|uniref:glycosyltransferase family 4 protein n=1 Tax=Kocuria sp. ZOR0020 TaxID=1339234 RepID=UPI0009DEA9CA
MDSRVQLLLNVPQTEMASIYRDARRSGGVLVSTSLLESFGYTVVEALSCHLPVVAFDLPALREHDSHGVDYKLVAPGDVLELKDAILALHA